MKLKRFIAIVIAFIIIAMPVTVVYAGSCTCGNVIYCRYEGQERTLAAAVESAYEPVSEYNPEQAYQNGGSQPWLGDWMYGALPIIIAIVGGLIILVVIFTIISKRKK